MSNPSQKRLSGRKLAIRIMAWVLSILMIGSAITLTITMLVDLLA
jgi:hypothetical protein